MLTRLPSVRCLSGLILGLLLAAPAWAQDKSHEMVIYNGSVRTVHAFPDKPLSLSDQNLLSDIQRLEKESSAANQLGSLVAQYIRDERELQRRRITVQTLLYGNSTSYGSGFYPGGIGGFGNLGFGFPLAWAYPYMGTSAFFPGYVGSAGTTTQSLAFGVGDEGVLKNELARVVAAQANPQYAAQLSHELASARLRASRSEALAQRLGIPHAAGAPAGKAVKLTLKDGTVVEGTEVNEDDRFITIDTGKEVVTVRKGDSTVLMRKQK